MDPPTAKGKHALRNRRRISRAGRSPTRRWRTAAMRPSAGITRRARGYKAGGTVPMRCPAMGGALPVPAIYVSLLRHKQILTRLGTRTVAPCCTKVYCNLIEKEYIE